MTLTPGSGSPTDATTRRPRSGRIRRFSRVERAVHHVTGLLMIILLVTAACLYVPQVATLVGRRDLVKPIHVYAGLALPFPILFGWLAASFRADVRRLNRFGSADREWLKREDRREVVDGEGVVRIGKFNAGQKLNAAFVFGSILVMLGTGLMLTFPDPWPDDWRAGATFVHDWLTLAVFVGFLGHLWYALRDRGALQGMITGEVTEEWAAAHHSGWYQEVNGQVPHSDT
ncbi:MAG: cytochrome b/b6 domain-containing protein [Streptosporangiaceae bacterium]